MSNEPNVVTLDLRQMPPPQRHATILTTYEGLAVGQTLRIVNDHEPKPLYYQFSAERPGEFEWTYRTAGPVDWEVDIKKLKNGTSKTLREQVEKALGTIRPHLQADGGDIELVDVSAEGVVSVRLAGACRGCPGALMTLKMGVERALKRQVPEVTRVEAVLA